MLFFTTNVIKISRVLYNTTYPAKKNKKKKFIPRAKFIFLQKCPNIRESKKKLDFLIIYIFIKKLLLLGRHFM